MVADDGPSDEPAGDLALLDEALRGAMVDVRGAVEFLIAHREALRDEALMRLEREASDLVEQVREVDRRKLLEELACFRDVLALHRRLVDNGDAGR